MAGGHRAPGYGTRGFEARLEVRKLNAILAELYARDLAVEAQANRLLQPDADLVRESETIRRDIVEIERQLASHERDIDSYEAGRGFVAAESTMRAGGRDLGLPLRESRAMAAANQRLRTVEAALERNPPCGRSSRASSARCASTTPASATSSSTLARDPGPQRRVSCPCGGRARGGGGAPSGAGRSASAV